MKVVQNLLSNTNAKLKSTQDLIMVLDRSGSMGSVRSDLIGGINQYLGALRSDKSVTTLLTMIQFDSEILVNAQSEVLNPSHVLSEETYVPRGSTSLYDAIGYALSNTKIKGDLPPVLVIYTDGYENSSKEWDSPSIKKLIDEKKELGWAVTFMGADQDAWATAQGLGVTRLNSISVTNASMSKNMAYLGQKTMDLRSGVVEANAMFTATCGSTLTPEEAYAQFNPPSTVPGG